MAVCTFFGHRDCPGSVRHRLREVVAGLIERENADMFYVGRQGAFDAMVLDVLAELSFCYPHIRYAVVLERMPGKHCEEEELDAAHTLVPEGAEDVHPRYAIAWRNRWMISRADIVVTYVVWSWGGAAQFEALARRQQRKIICLREEMPHD